MTTDNSQTFDGNKYPDSSSPDYELAAGFIAEMAMGTYIHLSSFDPSDQLDQRKPLTKVFKPRDDPAPASAFIRESVHHRCNTFYCANVGNPNVDAPPRKDSITHLRALVIDIDPEAIPINPAAWSRERLRLKEKIHDIINGELPPTWVIDTGNGAQLIYQFSGPNPIALDAALMTTARDTQHTLTAIFRADKTTATLEHLFRIPGTGNFPPESKRQKGGREGFAGLWLKNGKRWDLTELHAAAKRIADVTGRDANDETHTLDDVPNCKQELIDIAYKDTLERAFWDDLRRTIRDLRESNRKFDRLFKRLNEHPNRSAKDFRFCIYLHQAGVAPCDSVYALAAYGARKKTPRSHDWYKYLASTVMRVPAYLKKQQGEWYDDSEDDDPQDNEQPTDNKPRRWTRFNDEIDAELDTNPLVRNLIGRRGLSMLYGPSNAGKSLAALSLCSSIVSKTPFAGMRVNAHTGCVVYVVMEGSGGLRPRLRALKAQHPDRDHDELSFISGEFDMRMSGKDKDNGTSQLIDTIRDISRTLDKPVVFIVIDMLLIAANGGNENSSEDMGSVFQNLARLERNIGAHVMVLHHTGKNPTAGARGWSGMRGRVDTEIELVPDDEQPSTGRLIITKQRDMEIIRRQPVFNIVSHRIATDAEGNPITGAVAVFDEYDSIKPNSNEKMILDILQDIGRRATLEEIVAELKHNNPQVKKSTVKTQLHRMHRKRLIGYAPGKPAVYWPMFDGDDEPNDPFN
jgi:hypothetical protein